MKKICIAALAAVLLASCGKQTKPSADKSIAVFVPGIMSGNPVYEMLAEGITSAAADYNQAASEAQDSGGNSTGAEKPSARQAVVSVIEAGTEQSEWAAKLTALAASGKYDVIFSSNPSLPDIALPLARQFPQQKFILLDAFCENCASVATVRYNQREQAYLTGFAAGLVSSAESSMRYANTEKKIALVAAQEYPVMNTVLLPSFEEGARAADPAVSVEFRVVGNWYDASKAETIARALYQSGTDVILPIAGGASQGVIAAAKDCGFYVSWFDDNGFSKAPGYVISSSVLEQRKMAYEMTLKYLRGEIEFGTAQTVGIQDGYVHFVIDDPLYIETVDEGIREKIAERVKMIEDGELLLPLS
ncbi:MAG: BMP family ABC transporter substrate-binding protein [Bacteroides sp.]|nr:BMP family ABC transporter substrate-binding protein [Prevotella sp.]MCM1407739.1 BMP family ABC transporter substrate-binding protein [Treponema brennaborense]MCM1469111.1 BMP family ABC transporter substrate-binding protein [Bacteroides sp.]